MTAEPNKPTSVANLADERLIREGEAAAVQYLAAKKRIDAMSSTVQHAVALRQALDEWQAAGEWWIEKTLALSMVLTAARDACGKDDRSFGAWLAENGCDDLGRHTRAAFINMGMHIELARKILETTERKSIELIWEKELRPLIYPSARIDQPVDHQIAQQPQTATESRPAEQSAVSEKPSQHLQLVPKLKKGHRLSDWPRAEEIISLYQHSKTRGTITRLAALHNGKQVWKLMTQALDAGLLRSNNIVIEAITARLLFPHDISGRSARFLHTYDLTKPAGRKAFEADLLPRMIANKDALLAAPDDIEDILNRARRQQQSEQKEAIVAERVNKALAALPPDESEVIMFGKRMWPIVEGETIGAYDFRTLQVAVWKFTDSIAGCIVNLASSSCHQHTQFNQVGSALYRRVAERQWRSALQG